MVDIASNNIVCPREVRQKLFCGLSRLQEIIFSTFYRAMKYAAGVVLISSTYENHDRKRLRAPLEVKQKPIKERKEVKIEKNSHKLQNEEITRQV